LDSAVVLALRRPRESRSVLNREELLGAVRAVCARHNVSLVGEWWGCQAWGGGGKA
jgi:hypothetical protein